MGAVGCSTYQETGVAFKQQDVPVSVAHCIQYIPSEVAMSGDWVVESVIGRRKAMEDAYCHGAVSISSGAGISSEVCIAGVFDGHGGDSVAKFAAKNMPARLCRQLQEQGIDNSATASALKSAFFSIDEELLRSKAAQLKGSTAVVSLITRQNVHIAACGDSRAVICRTDGARQLVQDHSPSRVDEQARIQQAGGQVLYHNGCRVMGALAMSRALGDHALRPYGVIADPDVAMYTRQPEDEFLLLASDGLWGTVSNEDACTIISMAVTELMDLGLTRQQVTAVLPRMLTKVAMGRGSNDNITVLMMDLHSSSSRSTKLSKAQCQAVPTEAKKSSTDFSRITSAAVACIKRIIQEAIMSYRRQMTGWVAEIPVARAVSAPAAAVAPASSALPHPAGNLLRSQGTQAEQLQCQGSAAVHDVALAALAAKLKQLPVAVKMSQAASEQHQQHTHKGERPQEEHVGSVQQQMPVAMTDLCCPEEPVSVFATAAAQYVEESSQVVAEPNAVEAGPSPADHGSLLTSPFEQHQQTALAQVWTDWRSFSSSSVCQGRGSQGLTGQVSGKSRKRTMQEAPQQQHSGSWPSQDSSSLNYTHSAPAQIKLLRDEPPFKKFASAMPVQHVALQASA